MCRLYLLFGSENVFFSTMSLLFGAGKHACPSAILSSAQRRQETEFNPRTQGPNPGPSRLSKVHWQDGGHNRCRPVSRNAFPVWNYGSMHRQRVHQNVSKHLRPANAYCQSTRCHEKRRREAAVCSWGQQITRTETVLLSCPVLPQEPKVEKTIFKTRPTQAGDETVALFFIDQDLFSTIFWRWSHSVSLVFVVTDSITWQSMPRKSTFVRGVAEGLVYWMLAVVMRRNAEKCLCVLVDVPTQQEKHCWLMPEDTSIQCRWRNQGLPYRTRAPGKSYKNRIK